MKIVCVSNRLLCKKTYLFQMENIIKASPDFIILREKDLKMEEYKKLAKEIQLLCNVNNVPLMIHSHVEVAYELENFRIHLSFQKMRDVYEQLKNFESIGVSVHTKEEAIQAQKMGATYLLAGHIFDTKCKQGVPPRGLNYLKEIKENVSIPVIGIGGITKERMEQVIKTNADGIAIMSGLMECDNPDGYLRDFKNIIG